MKDMGLGRGASSAGVSATKKAKYLGSFVTTDCDERVYLPAIVSGLSGSAARSRRVLVEVDERELRVRPRSRLALLGVASAEPSERAPIDDLCVVHMCVTEPRLIVFVVRAAAAASVTGTARRRRQQQPPRYRVMVFLCKKPRHARQLLDAASDAKFLADRVADKSVFVVGRQPMTRYESVQEAVVDEGVQTRRQLRPRYYSDGSVCGDNDGVVVEGHIDYEGGGDSYRAFDLDGATVDELHPLPPPQQLQQSQQQTWQRRWRRQQQRNDAVAKSPSEQGTLNRGTRTNGFWHSEQRRGGGGGGETTAEVAFATAPRTYDAAAARRSRSMADIAVAGGGGGGGGGMATASRGFSRHVSSASTTRSSPPRVRQFAAQPSEPPQWVYAKGEGAATAAPRAGQTLSFGTTTRRTGTATLSDGEMFEGSRTHGHYRAATQGGPAAAELGWRGARRSLSSFTPSSGSSDEDDDASSGWTTSDARTTTVTTGRRAATLSSSSPPPSSSLSPPSLHVTQADIYAVPRSGRQRQQHQYHHDGASSSYRYASTLPDRTSTARRQFA